MEDFGEYLMTSGLILNPNVTWVSHNSLFDYGYLLRIITNAPLPIAEPTIDKPSTPLYAKFLTCLDFYLKHYYDLKVIVEAKSDATKLRLPLSILGQAAGVVPLSPQNQSGSYAMTTLGAFLRFRDEKTDKETASVLCGIDKHEQ